MILGNLYREKGQVGRAVNVHESLLQRRGITALEHAYVMLCLGLDFRHGGFIDRAIEAFTEVPATRPQQSVCLAQPPEAVRRAAPVGGGLARSPAS